MLNFFNKKSIGIDISDNNIEVIELEKKGTSIKVTNSNRVKLGKGIVEDGRIKNKEKLKLILNELLKGFNRNNKINFALSESQTYIHVFDMKVYDESKLDLSLEREIEKNIPLEYENLIYSYKVLSKEQEKMKVLVAIVNLAVVEEWNNFFKKINLKLTYFDIETLASFRPLSLVKKKKEVKKEEEKRDTMLIDIGSATTHISVFKDYNLNYAYSFPKAGDYFTERLSKRLKISSEKAELIKKKINLKVDNKLSKVFIKEIDVVLKEVVRSLNYWQKSNGATVKEVILLGGSSKIKGLLEHFSKVLNLEVVLADSYVESENKSFLYLGAMGISLKNLDKRWKDDPNILVEDIQAKKDKNEKEQEGVIGDKPTSANLYATRGLESPGDDDESNLKSKFVMLIIIGVVGVILILGAFIIRGKNRAKSQIEAERKKQEAIQAELDLRKKLDAELEAKKE